MPHTASSRRERIAVIGGGISGMGCAWLLGRHHDVVLYEANSRLGGHTNTVDVTGQRGTVPVDTGFIVYNEKNYPLLTRLFAWLKLPTQASDMSFGVSIAEGRTEYAGDNLNTLFAQRANLLRPGYWSMLMEILRFNRETLSRLECKPVQSHGQKDHDSDQAFDGMTLGEYLDAGGYSDRFRTHYLLPMGGAIWSCPLEAMLAFPAASFARFFQNHGLLSINDRPSWRTVTGGSREYLRRLVADFNGRVRRGARVSRVSRDGQGVLVVDQAGRSERFDRVVMAAHADESLAMLADASDEERRLLGAFGFQENKAYLHTDTSFLPRRRLAWSSWNYLADGKPDSESNVSVSYWMNRLQSIPGPDQWIVTLNPLRPPDPAKVHYEIEYMHPVFSKEAIAAQQELDRIQGPKIHFCGAWTGYGFHEDGFRSAIQVAERLGVRAPWCDVDEAVAVRGHDAGPRTKPKPREKAGQNSGHKPETAPETG